MGEHNIIGGREGMVIRGESGIRAAAEQVRARQQWLHNSTEG